MAKSFSRLVALSTLIATGLLAAAPSQAADRSAPGLFDRNTMQGWQRTTGASAMAYFNLPFHATKTSTSQPHIGFAMTAPHRVNGAGVLLHTDAPRFVDLRLNATDFKGGWTSAIYVGSSKAWTYDPTAAPGEKAHNMFESGTSWVVVGLLGAATLAGAFALTENGT